MPELPTIEELQNTYEFYQQVAKEYEKILGNDYIAGRQLVDNAVKDLSSATSTTNSQPVEEKLNILADRHKQLLNKLYNGPLKAYQLKNGHNLQQPPDDYKTSKSLGILFQSCLTRAHYLLTMLNLTQQLIQKQNKLEFTHLYIPTKKELNQVLNDYENIGRQITDFLELEQKPQFSAVKYDDASQLIKNQLKGKSPKVATLQLQCLNNLLIDYINKVNLRPFNSYSKAAESALKANDTTNSSSDPTEDTEYQSSNDDNAKIYSMLSVLQTGVKERDKTDHIQSTNSRLYSYLTAFWQEYQGQLEGQAKETIQQLLGINPSTAS